jgi:hypothetical protein
MKDFIPLVTLSIGLFVCACTKTHPEAKAPEVTIVLDGTSSMAEAIPCTASVLRPRGASPLLGRDFVPDDFRGSSPTVAILGTAVWRSAFGARPDIIGRTVQIGGRDFVVVGVAPDEPAELSGRKAWLATKS